MSANAAARAPALHGRQLLEKVRLILGEKVPPDNSLEHFFATGSCGQLPGLMVGLDAAHRHCLIENALTTRVLSEEGDGSLGWFSLLPRIRPQAFDKDAGTTKDSL